MGLNVHTVQFKPDLYKPIAKHVRDYHRFNWDIGDETDYYPQFPFARNGVDWSAVYGSWKNAGYVTDASVMFDDTPRQSGKTCRSIPGPTDFSSQGSSGHRDASGLSNRSRSATNRASTTTRRTASCSRTPPAA